MKKLIVSGIIGLSLIGAVASAQTYSSCVSISGTLAVGSRSSQVLSLQQFLVSQNYPGSGAWMETGYYGQATAAAVRDFQRARGLPQTGIVDSMTLSALQNCGNTFYSYSGYPGYTGTAYPYGTTYPYNYSYPYNTNYGYNYGYGTPTITSLSQNTGMPGQSVTIYGQGFLPTNTVYFNGQAIAANSNGSTQITFTIPYLSYAYSYAQNQSVNLYVGNANGTSNSITFTLNPSTCNGYYCGTCGTYPYSYGYTGGNCGTCGFYNSYPYTNNCQGNTSSPTITFLSPQSGGVGTTVTIYGSGFTTGGNTVHFGSGIVTGLQSSDGQSISFVVPSQLTGYGSQPIVLGTYNVSVTNSVNATTNAAAFTITSTNGSGSAPTITNVSGPTSLTTGQQGTWTMTINTQGNTYTSVSAYWGDNGNGYANQAAPQTIYGTQIVTFTHAYVSVGTYTLNFTVSNSSGQSNTYTSTVYVSGSGYNNGAPSISLLSPSSGYVGTQVTIYGSNFSVNGGNTINFGANGAIQNVYSNGNSITFTVPSYTTPYCTPGLYCGVQPTQVTPGTYNVSVMDQYGTSNMLSFTVL